MKVAYILNTPNAANYKVGTMILPHRGGSPWGGCVRDILF